jgi:hypothetical protein
VSLRPHPYLETHFEHLQEKPAAVVDAAQEVVPAGCDDLQNLQKKLEVTMASTA